jgi:hypothetical protein
MHSRAWHSGNNHEITNANTPPGDTAPTLHLHREVGPDAGTKPAARPGLWTLISVPWLELISTAQLSNASMVLRCRLADRHAHLQITMPFGIRAVMVGGGVWRGSFSCPFTLLNR